jgi:hypothetical protein
MVKVHSLLSLRLIDDLTADDVKKFKPSPELRRLFVPLIDEPSSSIMLAVQVHYLISLPPCMLLNINNVFSSGVVKFLVQ